MFLRPLPDLNALDEQPQQLGRQLVDGSELLGLLDEGVHIGDRGFQPLQLILLRWDGELQLLLLRIVVGGEHSELLVGHTSQHIVLVKPFKQGAQFSVPAAHGVQLLLHTVDLPSQFQGVLLVDVLGELPLLHPGEVGHSAQIVQHDLLQIHLSDLMRRAGILPPLAVGGAPEVVLILPHLLRPAEHQVLSAVGAVDQAGEQVWFLHVLGRAAFVRPYIPHDVPQLLRYQRRMGVLHQDLLTLRSADLLFVLVGERCSLKGERVAEVDDVLQDIGHRLAAPAIWAGRVQVIAGSPRGLVILVGRVQDLLSGQDPGDLVGAFPSGTQFKDPPYYRGSHLIWYDLLGVLILLLVAVGGLGARTFPALCLHFLDVAHLLAGVLGVELVGPVPDGVEVVAALHQGVHTIVDRDEPDALLREVELHEPSHLQVLPSQPAEILDDQGLHLTVLDHLHDFLPRGPVEVGPGVSVVRQEQGVLKSIVCRVLLQKQLLESDLSRVISAKNTKGAA